jgi:hypothetical protein
MSTVGRNPDVTDDEILAAIRQVEYPVATVSDIEERVTIGRDAVLTRLNKLAKENRVAKKKVGARAAVWWVPEPEPQTSPAPDASRSNARPSSDNQ